MNEAVVAKRYAEALFQLAKEKGSIAEVQEQLTVVKEVLNENAQFVEVIQTPSISQDRKLQAIDETFKSAHPFVLNLLKVLTERQRLNIATEVVDAYANLYNEENGVAVVTVQSVRELSEDEQASLKEIFKNQLSKQEVIIKNEIDPSILGGIKAKVGNTIYDGSVSDKLNRLRNQIVSATK